MKITKWSTSHLKNAIVGLWFNAYIFDGDDNNDG